VVNKGFRIKGDGGDNVYSVGIVELLEARIHGHPSVALFMDCPSGWNIVHIRLNPDVLDVDIEDL